MDLFSAALQNHEAKTTHPGKPGTDDAALLPAILDGVRSFCATHIDGARIDREGRLGSDVLREIADRGWFGLTVPEEFGGAGLSVDSATRVVSELAANNGSLGTCIGLHSGLAMHALLTRGASPAQKRFLPEIAAGERITAFAATEPGAGSDISSVRTTLSERAGKLWLDGSKCYVTNGGICGLVTVLARSPGLGGARAGHTLVLVDPRAPGVVRGREEDKLGLKGSSTVTIDFEGVEIPREHVLGDLSKGLEYAHEALSWGRTFMAAGCLGTTRAALADATEHVRRRQQFGRALSSFPLVSEAIAYARAEVLTIDRTLQVVCGLADAGASSALLASSALKVLASEGAWSVVDRAVQLMGASGYMEETGTPRRLRDVRVTRIFEGANDVLRMSLASASLAWPVARLGNLRVARFVPEDFSAEAQEWDTSFGELNAALVTLKRRWGYRLFEQQTIAAALADGIIATFGALAVLLFSSQDESTGGALSKLAIAVQLERARAALAQATEPRQATTIRLLEAVAALP